MSIGHGPQPDAFSTRWLAPSPVPETHFARVRVATRGSERFMGR